MLTLSQIQQLRAFLNDPDGKTALMIFFDKEKRYHLEQCTSSMLQGNVEAAKKSAHFATAYETVMSELRHFLDNQSGQTRA